MIRKIIWRETFKNKFILPSLLQRTQLDFFQYNIYMWGILRYIQRCSLLKIMFVVFTNVVQIVRQCVVFNTRIWCSVHTEVKIIYVERQKGKITNCISVSTF